MAIKFTCRCGKGLKADDQLAGRGTKCPQCSEPVRIPQQSVTNCSPRSQALKRSCDTRSAVNRPLGNNAEITLRRVPRWYRFVSWHGSSFRMPDSFSACLNVAARLQVGLYLGLITGFLIVLLQHDLNRKSDATYVPALICIVALVGPALFAYAAIYLTHVLDAAASGRPENLVTPTSVVSATKNCLARWIGSFLAGPVFVFAGCAWYWVHCGAMSIWDWSILGEVTIATIGYWMAAILSSGQHGPAGLTPVRVFQTMSRVRTTFFKVSAFASAVIIAHFALVVIAAEMMPTRTVSAFAMICLGWGLTLSALAIPLRWLGAAYFETRPQRVTRRTSVSSKQSEIAGHSSTAAPVAGHVLAPQS